MHIWIIKGKKKEIAPGESISTTKIIK
jgi:hypothetical protein